MTKKSYITPIIDIDTISDSDDHLLAGLPSTSFDYDVSKGTEEEGITEADAKATLFDYPDYFEDEDMWELASSYTMP